MKPFALSSPYPRENVSALVCIDRLPSYNNTLVFCEELTKSVCMALKAYHNIRVIGDFTIDVNKGEGIGHDKLDVFCDTLNLTNLLNSGLCYTSNHKSTIGLCF